jgi:hypothetical protein
MKGYPQYICQSCGAILGQDNRPELATWRNGACDVCHRREIAVTEPRDFGHLRTE